MRKKLIKLWRRYRWSASLNGLPVFWHVGCPNFGDDLNPWLWWRLLQEQVRFSSRDRPHILGMGSILESATPNSLIAGSGFIRQPTGKKSIRGTILSVRGYRSAEYLECKNLMVGDPAVLVNQLFPQAVVPEFEFGLIPHVTEVTAFKRTAMNGVHLIDPAWSPHKVLREVCRCRNVASQSLHGLIVSDAYGIANAWISPGEKMIGGSFKFEDYYSTTVLPKSPCIMTSRTLDFLSGLEYSVSSFRPGAAAYADQLRAALMEHLVLNTSRAA